MGENKGKNNWNLLAESINKFHWKRAYPKQNLCMTCAEATVQVVECEKGAQTPPALQSSDTENGEAKILVFCKETGSFMGSAVRYCDRHCYDVSSESEHGYLKGIEQD